MTVLSRAVKIGKPARDRRGNPIISLNQVKEASPASLDRFAWRIRNQGGHMQNDNPRIRIELTDDQRKQIKATAGREVSALEFAVEELEQRIAPVTLRSDGGGSTVGR
jgi:hypothetical protein